jgi:hypothetical protein
MTDQIIIPPTTTPPEVMHPARRWWIYIVIVAIVGVGAFVGGKYSVKSQIKIVRETKTVERIIRVPGNCDEYKQCFDNPLDISGVMAGNMLTVKCSSGCKEAEHGFELESSCAAPRNILSTGIMMMYVDGKLKALGGVGYSRSIWRSIYLGGSIYSNGNDYAGEIKASLAF